MTPCSLDLWPQQTLLLLTLMVISFKSYWKVDYGLVYGKIGYPSVWHTNELHPQVFFVAKLTFCSSLPLLNSLWWTLFHLFHTVYGTGRVSVIGDCKQTPNSFHKIQISTWFQHRRQFYVFRTVNMPTPVFTIKKYTYSVNLNTMGDLCQLVLQLGDCGKLLNTLKSVVLTICRAKE